jgi:F-type H+-transporting ATPase subunit epsilon
MSIHVDIVSVEGAIWSGEAKMVFAPARMGEIGIAPRHAPLLTDLRPGAVRVEAEDGEEKFFYVTGGVLEVQPHLVTVLADSALHAEQLDETAALAARERAREVLEGRHGEIDLVAAAQGQARLESSRSFRLRPQGVIESRRSIITC